MTGDTAATSDRGGGTPPAIAEALGGLRLRAVSSLDGRMMAAVLFAATMAFAPPAEASRCQVVTPIGVRDEAFAAAVQPDGKILLAGYSNDGASDDFALARYLPTGDLDGTFGTGGTVTTPINSGNEQAISMALQADGKIVLAGFSDVGGSDNDFAVVRYNADGSLDTTGFNSTGALGGLPNTAGMVTTSLGTLDDEGRGVAIQADGKIVVAGWRGASGSRDIAVVRYNTDGSLDTAGFNPTGTSGGAPNVAGMVTTAIGTADDEGWHVVIQPSDQRILVVGDSSSLATGRDMALVRYNSDGSLDTGLGGTGTVTTDFGAGDDEHARGVAIRSSDNKIVVGGSHNPGVFDFAAARYDTAGGLDGLFGTGGFVTTDLGGGHDIGQAMTLQADEKVLVAGWTNNGTNWDFGLVRYDANGTADPGFGTGGVVTTAIGSGDDLGQAVLVQSDGKIVEAGSSFSGSDLHFAWARYNTDGSPDVTCPAVDEVHYRWRWDDGTEATATFMDAEDTKLVGLAKNRLVRLRFEASTLGTLGSGPTAYQLQVAESASCPSAAPVLGAQTLAAGAYHTCVRLNSGEIQCWGHNGEGEVGDGTNTDPRPNPLTVSGLTDATQVTAGAYHTCAARPSGSVECWGGNWFGALGDGTTSDHWTPAPVSGISTASHVVGGAYHTCARLSSGGVECWGYNSHGQVGDNSTTERDSPVSVSGMTDANQVTTGDYHTCALRATGAVECWGDNSNGQLGDGSTTDRHTPVPVSGLSATAEVSGGGYHTCALATSGTVSCWGDNSYGQLGDASTTERHTPVPVSGLSGVVQIAAGDYHTCALLNTGAVSCWGRNAEGQLGDTTTSQRTTPVSVSGITNAVEVAAGWYHSCAVLATGEVACWGDNSNGQLGDGTTGGTATTPTTWVPSSGPTLPYAPVPTDTSGHWQIADSANFTDGDPTADNAGLTNAATTFVAGQLKDTGNSTGSLTLAPDAFTEIEFAVQATNNATDGGDYCFRLYDATNDYVLGNYPVYAQVQLAPTTAVELMDFEALGSDSAVHLVWRTGSELDNLGFNLDRSLSASGPWTRITPSLVPGLGTSAVGASYSWRDVGLQNGTRYFYRLEDVDTRSVSTFHGPVSAIPQAEPAPPGDDGSSTEGDTSGTSGGDAESEAGGSSDQESPATGPVDEESGLEGRPACASSSPPVFPCAETYGDPEQVSLRVLSRTEHQVVVELLTGGFYAIRDARGQVRAVVPGFDERTSPRAPALPLRRVLLEAVVGRKARLASVEAEDEQRYPGLVPAAVGYPEMQVDPDGTVRPARREASLQKASGDYLPASLVRLGGELFQGETKKLALELSPLRYDVTRGELVLDRRLLVKVVFLGRELRETGSGFRGRRRPRSRPGGGQTLGVLMTARKGLYAVPFETLFPGRRRTLSTTLLRLQHQGEAVPFHIEPAGQTFGPGGILFFYADREASSSAFTGEVAWELVRAEGGIEMPTASAAPFGDPVASSPWGEGEWETNRIYQSGLLEAKDPWLWEAVFGGASRSVGFTLSGLAPSSPGRLVVLLQGGSDAGGVVDHHLRILVNGAVAGETRFDGKSPLRFEADLPASVLREGENTLTVENVGDTGVYSLVFLDRFSVEFAESPALREGRFEGSWGEAGTADVETGATRPVAVDLTDPTAPRWLTSLVATPSGVRLRAEARRRYLLVSSEGTLVPRIVPPVRSTLKETTNQADYVLIAPEAFLPAARPLLERRKAQGLTTKAVSLEEIASVFGYGEPSGEAIHRFLTYAFHEWAPPSLRYVLLLGDASYDPRNFTGLAEPAPLPALWKKTTYLWTASDPALAAVNGDDSLPDVAIGRLPATTLEQAEALVAKILDWEDSGQGLSGRAVFVADNPDPAGNFEADVDDVRESFFADQDTTTIKLRETGADTRPAILDAFNQGASLMSYVGHGGVAVWASENVWNSWDVSSLQVQSRQPFLLTLNCLNGYFVAPNFDSLAEAMLKADGRGAIAAFSPTGLSLDGPAHVLHRAIMAEVSGGTHERLGDAILAAEERYTDSGQMPELLTIYHLFADPAMRIR